MIPLPLALQSIGDPSHCYNLDPKKSPHLIGRSEGALITIASRQVSRKHGVIEFDKNHMWTITNFSPNGILVNGVNLAKQGPPKVLHEGDVIQFGIACPTEDGFNIRYRLIATPHDDGWGRKRSQPSSQNSQESPSAKLQRSLVDCQREQAKAMEAAETRMKEQLAAKERELREMQERLEAKDTEKQEMRKQLEEEKKRMEEANTAFKEQVEKEKEALREKMEREKTEMKMKLEDELGQQLERRESELRNQLDMSRMGLISDRVKVEEKLRDMEKKLLEKDETVEAELKREKAKLDTVIGQMELKQKMLETELTNCRSECDKEKGQALQVKEEMLRCFTDLAETELQCCICQELFIKASTLNCSHSFCLFCISQWRESQGKSECPICRQPITSNNRALVLDSYIEKLIEQMSDELKTHRKRVVAERTELENAAAIAKASTPTVSGLGDRGARGGGQGRGGARVRRGARVRGGARGGAGRGGGEERGAGRRGGQERGDGRGGRAAGQARGVTVTSARVRRRGNESDLQIVAEVPPPAVIVDVHDDDDDDDDDSLGSLDSFISHDTDNDSDGSLSSEEGLPGVYYGGWGSCFNCGRRGHWSNGCPYR